MKGDAFRLLSSDGRGGLVDSQSPRHSPGHLLHEEMDSSDEG